MKLVPTSKGYDIYYHGQCIIQGAPKKNPFTGASVILAKMGTKL